MIGDRDRALALVRQSIVHFLDMAAPGWASDECVAHGGQASLAALLLHYRLTAILSPEELAERASRTRRSKCLLNRQPK
jgi:hypothetical protein